MKSSVQKIKTLFIKKMVYSAIAQILVLGLLIFFIKNYLNHNHLNAISDNLLIKDQYTIDEIASHHLLGNKYALDLELHNLGDMRKLDSIKFASDIKNIQHCSISNGEKLKLCQLHDGHYLGVTVIQSNNSILGYVLASKKYDPIFNVSIANDLLYILLTVAGIFVFNFAFLFLSLKKRIEINTQLLLNFVSPNSNVSDELAQLNIAEYKAIAEKLISERKEILRLQNEKIYYEAKKTISEQVAHDMRSPLAAINTAVRNLSGIPENWRIMIRNASKRLNDIANNLLNQSNGHLTDVELKNEIESELVFMILDSLISEKRYEYYNTKTNIQLHISDNAYNCFSKINPASFKRVLSNLINNSVEAIDAKDNGLISIFLDCDNDHVEICIKDNGCGIPSNFLPKVTNKGFSYNKKSGCGIGLSYAKHYIEQLNGELSIMSEINVGTTIKIKLPCSESPRWFCESLDINSRSTIVVLDDDPSIHDIWNEKLHCIPLISLIHFTKASDLTLQKIIELNPSHYLIDYELLADIKNGLDVIEELSIGKKATLVTSCFEDPIVRNRCETLGVKIIPKSYVPFIPIAQIPNSYKENNPIVFIDDDEALRMAWSFAASAAGKDLKTYSSPGELNKEISNYAKTTVIYIDSDLGNNIQGELFAKKLYENGFTEIYLTTGYSQTHFDDMPWIKAIISKEPPFFSQQGNLNG